MQVVWLLVHYDSLFSDPKGVQDVQMNGNDFRSVLPVNKCVEITVWHRR